MLNLDEEALSVIEKVKKLLSLAQNNDNEHQAAAASAKAMELLAAYNLDMAVVGQTTNTAQRTDNKRKGGLYAWQRDLWQAVCELNFCMYWSIKGLRAGSSYEHRVLGRHENVVSSEVMAEYLQSTVERLAQTWARDRGYNSVFVKEAIAYREGMARRLTERLAQLRRDRLEEDRRKEREQAAASRHPGAAPGTGIVLASVIQSEHDLNEDYLYGYEPGTTSRRRAEWKARQVAAQAAYQQQMAERDAMEAANPKLREERLAREAQLIKERDARWAKQDRYRERYYEKHGRYPGDGRARQETAQERRARMPSFASGYVKGGDVGLDQQIDENKKGALK